MFRFWFKKKNENILRKLVLTICNDENKHIDLSRVVKNSIAYINDLPIFYSIVTWFSLWVIEYLPIFSPFRLLPFSWSSLKQRLSTLEQWQGSWFYHKRLLFRTATAACVGVLYGEPKLMEAIEFKRALDHRALESQKHKNIYDY